MTDLETQAALRKLAAEYFERAMVIETEEVRVAALPPTLWPHDPA